MRGLEEIRAANEARFAEAAMRRVESGVKVDTTIRVLEGQFSPDTIVLMQGGDTIVVPFDYVYRLVATIHETVHDIMVARGAKP